MNLTTSSSRASSAPATGTGARATGPVRGVLTIEHLDALPEHAVALSTFCIATEAALPAGVRGTGQFEI
ncbi:hypothetical protein [Streptomyces olivochromogenes]|uniref:Uncharacterized protein n=1 Tax=Streptomyces olivochromogenes TaxID=1963 RepID=A0A250VCB6_STROL|nr:hypothetical protein [Streptomyces olivochromogenes]KUN45294.1 hypothetical protein AQJ27_20225 [Streptomyces olivochromogenes]GAX51801.1 hypothetical protein SO3561_03308 [Streptomyces olivochromogenes]